MPFLECYCKDLPFELLKKAKNELGETEEVKVRSLNKLKELIKGEPDFYPCMEDVSLLRFLRVTKFNVERAFEKCRKYYRYKAKHSRVLTDITVSEIKPVLDLNHVSYLNYRDQDGAGVMLIQFKEYDDKFVQSHIIASIFLCSQIALLDDINQIVGASVILDFDRCSLRTAMKFSSVTMLYNVVKGVQDYMPIRIKAIHIVNQAYYITFLYSIIEKFLSEKSKKRLHFHGKDLNSLHRYVPPDILPEELGGHQGSCSKSLPRLISELESREQDVIKMNTYGYRGNTLHNIRRGK